VIKKILTASIVFSAMIAGSASAEDALVVSTWGGNFRDMIDQTVGQEFTKETGVPVKYVTGGTIDRLNKAKLASSPRLFYRNANSLPDTTDYAKDDAALANIHKGMLKAAEVTYKAPYGMGSFDLRGEMGAFRTSKKRPSVFALAAASSECTCRAPLQPL
jgi:hypothetical protein